MSSPATVTEFRAEAKAQADQTVNALQSQLAQLNLDVTGTEAALVAATKQVAADQQANAKLRVQLSQAALPSDAANLVAELQANLIQSRIDQAALGAATDAATAASRAQAAATAALAAALATQTQAGTDLAAAQADDNLMAQWTNTVQSPAVTAALASAAPAAVTPLVSAATNALEAAIGTGMVALFEHRRTDWEADHQAVQSSVTAAAAAMAAAQTAQAPLAGALTTAAGAYQVARQALADLAQNAATEAAAAVATLQAAATVGPLPPDELAALAAAKSAAAAQVTPEAKVATAKTKVRADLAAIDATTLTNLQTIPDFDGDTDPATSSDRAKLTTDQASVASAVAGVDETKIAAWEVLIPASVMSLLVAVVEAESTLGDLGAVDVTTVLGNLATAAATYGAALEADWTHQRCLTVLGDELARRQDDWEAAGRVASQREDAAIRGAS